MRHGLALFGFILGLPAVAGPFAAEVILLGEHHDNPAHHARQAELVAEIQPKALVFEMLTADQATAHVPGADEATLEVAFGWAESGWPDFAMYYPIFAAAPEAEVYGAAVPRADARASMEKGLVAAFGAEAARFGLTEALPETQQEQREAMQMAAHCDAMPAHMLPAMVDIQRLRDARLAQTALEAFAATGGPVVVITGNGHVRADWGVPVYLSKAAPELSVATYGQGEDGRAPPGVFDQTSDAPGVERPDPCAAFK